MVFVGLLTAFGVSLASFSLLVGLTSPQSGMLTIGLFFLTFFLTATSFFALLGMTGKWLAGRMRAASARKTTAQWGANFRRGLLLGAFVTVLVALETLNTLTLELSIVTLAPFALAEAYIMKSTS